MWIFTQDGFISAVDNNQRPGLLTVRARDRQSLAILADLAEAPIEFTPYRDYQYRVFVDREVLAQFMSMEIETLDYPNFKDRVHAVLGPKYHDAAAQVWSAMTDIVDDEALNWYASRGEHETA